MTAERVFHRIVVPTDFSACAEEAWGLAQRVAAGFDAELVLTHVLVETPLYSEGPFTMEKTRQVFESARRWAAEMLELWAAKARGAGLHVRVVLRKGVPHEEIVALATDEKADLVVIGIHGRGGVADRVVRLAPCPVLIVREPS